MWERLRETNPLIQILIGARQVGKTTAATDLYEGWNGPKHFATADAPIPPSPEWIRWQWERAFAMGRDSGKPPLLIIDEVQKVSGWSEQIKLLFDRERGKGTIKVLLLGSSSLGLQKGLNESLAGRFELLDAPHWSYAEFKEAFGWNLATYLRFGAYPGAAQFAEDEDRWRNYILNSIIEPVLGRDIIGQRSVGNPALFRQTFELAVSHPAHIISLNKMIGQLQDRGNTATMKHYLDLLKQSFLILPIEKYSGSPIQTKLSSPKIIVLNHALTHAFFRTRRLDDDPGWAGFFFESVVGAHLARLSGVQLYYWRLGNKEVDYVLKTPDRLVAIEVKSGLRRKGSGLAAFQTHYPHAYTELWDERRCIDFLEKGTL